MTYVPDALRRLVIERAAGRCEYCLYLQEASFLAFEMEHIILRNIERDQIEALKKARSSEHLINIIQPYALRTTNGLIPLSPKKTNGTLSKTGKIINVHPTKMVGH